MSELKATPGPWFVRELEGDQWPEKRVSIGPSTNQIAIAVAISPRHEYRPQMLHDAHLIAQAPAMYELLDEVYQDVTDAAMRSEILDVLAAARGEQS